MFVESTPTSARRRQHFAKGRSHATATSVRWATPGTAVKDSRWTIHSVARRGATRHQWGSSILQQKLSSPLSCAGRPLGQRVRRTGCSGARAERLRRPLLGAGQTLSCRGAMRAPRTAPVGTPPCGRPPPSASVCATAMATRGRASRHPQPRRTMRAAAPALRFTAVVVLPVPADPLSTRVGRRKVRLPASVQAR